jgi:glycosyltransferase involved in cell wall biosynthesis
MKIGLVWMNGSLGGVTYVCHLRGVLQAHCRDQYDSIHLFRDRYFPGNEGLIPPCDGDHEYAGAFSKPMPSRWWRKACFYRDVIFSGCGEADLARKAQETGVDVLYPYPSVWCQGVRSAILWVPDFQFAYLNDGVDPRITKTEMARKRRALMQQWAPVVLSSHHALKCAQELFGEIRARVEILRFRTIPEATWFDDPAPLLEKYGIRAPYFFLCNQFWKHKDHLCAFEAFRILEDQGHREFHLVMTGEVSDYRFPEYVQQIKTYLEKLPKNRVKMLGKIDRSDQMRLMRGAHAVLQPSRYEGWSTVLEDARLMGAVVIASDFPVHLEQDLPDARYFPRGDADALAQLMKARLSESPNHADSAELLRRHVPLMNEFGNGLIEIFRRRVCDHSR